MNTRDKIAKLQDLENSTKQLKSEVEREQKNCNHRWEKVKYDPDTEMRPYGHRITGQGSHIWSEPEGYETVEIPQWSRTCHHCGKVEYTKTKGIPKDTPTEPIFD